MSEFISADQAWIDWFNGDDIQASCMGGEWELLIFGISDVNIFKNENYHFRKKPKTITLNIEIPAPFEPSKGERFYVLDNDKCNGWSIADNNYECYGQFGAWRTKEEVEKVVSALRNAIK